jgi:hypothetical protein
MWQRIARIGWYVSVVAFNILLVYSLLFERDFVDPSVWRLLVARTAFGLLYFALSLAAHYYGRVRPTVSFWAWMSYHVALFGFALAELVVLSLHPRPHADGGPVSPVILGWIFVTLDWLLVFSFFVVGVFVNGEDDGEALEGEYDVLHGGVA